MEKDKIKLWKVKDNDDLINQVRKYERDEIINKIKLYFAKCMLNKRVPREQELLNSLGEK
jgi:hypothetical protein